MANAGFMTGYPNGNFMPNEKITRAELAVVISNVFIQYQELLSNNEVTPIHFSDIPETHWAHKNIETVSSLGIMSGNKGFFQPNPVLTRAEMAVISERILTLLNVQQ